MPPTAQRAVAGFLGSYGHRGVAEIDVGVARWAEEPAHILGAIANYLRLDDPELAPDVKFERGRREGEAMAAELARRVRTRSRIRGKLVEFCLRRVREIGGLRESPKFNVVLLLARVRELRRRHVPRVLLSDGTGPRQGHTSSPGRSSSRPRPIPAVVGVAHATGRIGTGQLVTVDGAAGTIATPDSSGRQPESSH
ncbi:MAG: hypothetical protein GEU83_01295 [Pseudonocardiaceae bacterium]|nr:hypothetical protein [Pseudonocardiaceae bacterium]